jgi:hypothetical protein
MIAPILFRSAKASSLFATHILLALFVVGIPVKAGAQTPGDVKYSSIRFIIQTGGDDLRGDSSASAQLFSINGSPLQTLTVKNSGGGSWPNNSTHTVEDKLSQQLSGNEIGTIALTLTSHNGFLETNDNWNVQSIAVELFSGSQKYRLVTKSGNPFVRLTGSAPTVKIQVPEELASGSLYPRYQIYALVYAAPGCTPTATLKCAYNGSVVYAQGSSNGTGVSVGKSFKGGEKIQATEGVPANNASESFEASKTTSSSTSETITKGKNNTLTAPGNGDGVDHGQDFFVILTNPSVTIQTLGPTAVGWTMGFNGPIPHFVYLSVQDLKDPEHMDAAKLAALKSLGFTSADYAQILREDPMASSSIPDPRRYTPVAWSFPYTAPNQASDCPNGVCSCPYSGVQITNQVQDQQISSTTDEITVELSAKITIPAILTSVQSTTTFTWTNTSSTTNTQSGTQSATANVACPSINYKGPAIEMDVYWDSLYGSFVFVPYTPPPGTAVATGDVVDAVGKAVPGAVVKLTYGGKVLNTITDRRGAYTFHLRAEKLAALPKSGSVEVRGMSQTVELRGSSPARFRLAAALGTTGGASGSTGRANGAPPTRPAPPAPPMLR